MGAVAATTAEQALLLRAAELVAAAGAATLSAHRPRDGAPGGSHASTRRGGGVEFAEHRDYVAGDDLRHLDWHAFARRDRLLIKRFETEVHSELWLVIDNSASMELHTEGEGEGEDAGVDKFGAVRTLALALALLALRDGDAVGLEVPAAGGVSRPAITPRGGPMQRSRLAQALASLEPQGLESLESWRPTRRGQATILAFSDVLSSPEAALAPLGALVRGGAEVTLVHVLHPREIDFAFADPLSLRCDETAATTVFDQRAAAEAAALMAAHREEVRHAALEVGVRYLFVDLGEGLPAVLREIVRTVTAGRRRG